MTTPVRGGVTIKVLTGRTAASLQRYRDDSAGKEGFLFAATRHCAHDVETQIAEWKQVREVHGTQGARRTQRATYETVNPGTGLHDNGRRGTHVKEYSGGRWRKRPVRDGEVPTHYRIEAGDLIVKESEAVHTIYAAGPDLVDPENPAQLKQFFDAVQAEREQHYPGLQESMWLERNGASGLAHVHVASNATTYEEFVLDGHDQAAGRKMAGTLTRVHDVRARFEKFLDENPEHGLAQSLARVGTEAYRAAQVRDGQGSYWENRRGTESSQDRIRRVVGEALGAAGVTDRSTFLSAMRSNGIEVSEVGLRRGVPGKNHDLAYRAAGAKQCVRGGTLGPAFTIAAVDIQLERRARGLSAMPLPERQRAGRPRGQHGDVSDVCPPRMTNESAINELAALAELLMQQQRPSAAVDAQDLPLALSAESESPTPEAVPTSLAEPTRAVSVAEPTGTATPRSASRAPQTYSSPLRKYKSAVPDGKQRLAALVELDESWHTGLPHTADERLLFEQQARRANVSTKVLKRFGEEMADPVRERLTERINQGAAYDAAVRRHQALTEARKSLERGAAADPHDLRGARARLRANERDMKFERQLFEAIKRDRDAGVYDTPSSDRAEHARRKAVIRASDIDSAAAQRQFEMEMR